MKILAIAARYPIVGVVASTSPARAIKLVRRARS
jgi:hypothetical protein